MKKPAQLFLSVLATSMLFLPVIAKAEAGGSAAQITSKIYYGSSLSTMSQFSTIVFNLINYFVVIIGIAAAIAILYGAILYVTAAGNESNAENGKKTIIYAAIGIIVAVAAYGILRLFINTGEQLRSHNNLVQSAYALPTLREITGGEDYNFNTNTATLINNVDEIAQNVKRQSQWIMIYGFIAAFVAILYASFLYLTAYGDSGKAEKAKKVLIFTVIGIIFMLIGVGIFRSSYTDIFQSYIPPTP